MRLTSGYKALHWGLGEIEVFGTGATLLPEDDLNINSTCDIQRGGVEEGIARFSINDIPGTDSYGSARIRAAE